MIAETQSYYDYGNFSFNQLYYIDPSIELEKYTQEKLNDHVDALIDGVLCENKDFSGLTFDSNINSPINIEDITFSDCRFENCNFKGLVVKTSNDSNAVRIIKLTEKVANDMGVSINGTGRKTHERNTYLWDENIAYMKWYKSTI